MTRSWQSPRALPSTAPARTAPAPRGHRWTTAHRAAPPVPGSGQEPPLSKETSMPVLTDLVAALRTGAVEIVDLTAPLSDQTPILELPEQFGQTARFQLEEISRYDDRGPAWYWNNFRTGEHTGTHFDAPNHWVTGKDLADIASVPVGALVAP